MAEKHRVVIIGGGFAGLNAAKALGSTTVDVTVIDKRNFHLFQALLYQVATGSLSPGDIAAPIRSVLHRHKNVRVLLGEVADIDTEARVVSLTDGDNVPFDSLIVAAGSKSTYFGKDHWRDRAPSLKSIEEATAIRQKIFQAFERAERLPECPDQKDWMTFAIVGAGATGVELAGALAEIARDTLKSDFRAIVPGCARIVLLDAGPRILSAFPEDLAARAAITLERMGVEIRTGVKVIDINDSGVILESNGSAKETLPARTVVWSAGIIASELGRILSERTGTEIDRNGRLVVTPFLTLPNHPELFIAGDLASFKDDTGKTLPGVAQVAMQQGHYAAKAVLRRSQGKSEIKPFHYHDKGTMAVIGRGAAIANIYGAHFDGFPAWLIWLFIHLMYIVQFNSRLRTFVQWGFEYMTYNRGARLITGLAPANRRDLK